ncbi:ABC transporter ATP-binding protein [Aggregatibacter actinomycetemcomitans]|uniref:ABC transporter ATP-binding protein n=6 Tax=Aggregatibacter actinomycetemcomitans TaxID=714 RepID=A0A5D0EL08_AGGAC|nr:ABC transporter ATP-binding protein/permease [Aggregatibacter actinomycetemcomitans]AFI86994.1 ABC transporter ATP-binding protein [Aggregatibacter actinomycetemcomitans D7S-1]KYK95135.1 cysteine ABC transporter ATP-binding protein [Aggregatibacter actinomycetemcomitans serotype d str. SA3733]AMQ94116.1 ABC transporter ATP-binding protein [Aggregatibacter actinomycetemcomitans]ANU81638.1 ABC transporter ATP-binding protein [Aggregatibacter actinomycetemcomitans]KND84689.1 ABC transporter AT
MMINKRLINTVADSKKWIAINVLWNWVALIGGIISAVVFAICLQWVFERSLTLQSAVIFTIVLIACLALRAWAGKMAVKASYKASTQVKHKLRTLIYQKLSSMPLNQVNQQSTSSVIQVASEGVEQLEIYFGRYLPQLFYSLLAPLTLFIFLVFFNAPTSLILLVCVPLIPMSIIAVNKIAKRLLAKYWSIYVGLGSSFLDNLQGLITLKIYQDDDYKAKQMDIEAENFRTITMKVLTMQLNSVSLMDLLAYGGAALGILTALLQFQDGNLSIFGVVLFILLASEFFIPLRLLGSFFHVAMNGKAASEKIFTLLDTPVEENKSAVDFPVKNEVTVQINDLHFAYSEEKPAINGLTLSIQPKQLAVFVGKSGCGKSTLVSLLMGFYQVQQGEILFNDIDIKQINRHSLYRYVSLVSHSSYIFKGSLRENMLMVLSNASDETIYQCLEQVNLANFVRENGGLEMPLLSRGSNLSGGQIQRLALARALLHNADVYIFDEATSNIDVESEEIILQFIQQFKHSKTIVMISHRLANAVNADQIYVLQSGRLAESGDHASLMAENGIYAEMFNQQKNLENIRMEANHA